ncbi:hypothetical protein [Amycolatopsis jejuensis]|uniref:hypothetical protein n=1 Tax=Amycolatopsis jejuensis TaxID=330084 RepID=UPI000526ADB0|nr:hypothetical protein [Amycolatopsis jejuensis]
MKRIAVVSTLIAAGMLSAAPAFASGSAPAPTPTPAPTTTAPAPAGDHAGVPKAFVRVLPSSGRAGDKVLVRVGCEASAISGLKSSALQIGKLSAVGPQKDPAKAPVSQATATVRKDVKPGTYQVSFSCGGAEIGTKFTVLAAKPATKPAPKQVTKVPSGAPQTGGTDGPVADSASTADIPIAAGAMGALAVGGAGFVLMRRRQRG